jgi:hypothetical protein
MLRVPVRVFLFFVGILALVLPASSAVRAQDASPFVRLVGRAVLPADTFAAGPPTGFAITGNTNGRAVPFASHPVQGFSAVLPLYNGSYLALSDNGFGAKANSPDYRLRWYRVTPNFNTGAVSVDGFTELSDPNGLVPFPIVNAGGDRVLTGGDFDPESFRLAPDGTFWIGEEFGPYLLHVDANGRLLDAPIATPLPPAFLAAGRGLDVVKSPDHPDFVSLPNADARRAAANLPSSRGFEGMALNASGTKLYPILEGPLFDDPLRNRLIIFEFDLASEAYTGKTFFYPMENPGHAIGDFTAINDNEFLIIERDNNQGEAAQFKRIYKVDLRVAGENGLLAKKLLVDLMAITDDNGITEAEDGAVGLGPVFSFPFVTIESVYPIDGRRLLVINDNNYPFSTGRRANSPDDNEFIVVQLPRDLELDL